MDTLNLYAELAIGLLGFSGVVSALGKSRLDIGVREFRVAALLTYSAMTLLTSLFPLILAAYQFEHGTTWMISTIVLMLLMPVGPISTARRYSHILNTDPFLKFIRVPIFLMLGTVWFYLGYGVVLNSDNLNAIYLVGVSYLLLMGVFHFCLLVSSIRFE